MARITSGQDFIGLPDRYPGAGCSKLTTSLVNVSLKIQALTLHIHFYILLETQKILTFIF